MKILLIQERGRHAENQQYRECECFSRAFNRMAGVEAKIWGLNYSQLDAGISEAASWADVLFLLENYDQSGWVPDLSEYRKLKMFLSIDSHCVGARHQLVARRNKIDIILSSIESEVPRFKDDAARVLWMPVCYPADLIFPRPDPKRWDVGFCGNARTRKDWIARLAEDYALHHDYILGDGMGDAVRSYRIHWNRNYSYDLSYRIFETLGCGTFLLTNETDKLADLFRIGTHLDTYTEYMDCLGKIRYYLDHEHERETIARAGREHAAANHTYDNRCRWIVNLLNEVL